MDPDANLKEQRNLVRKLTVAENSDLPFDEHHVACLVELVDSLDHWLTSGGFKPKAWN